MRDYTSERQASKPQDDYTPFLDVDGLRGARIGVARNFCGFDARVDRILAESIAAIEDLGATVIDPADIAHADQLGESEITVLHYEFKADLNAYLAGRGPGLALKSLADLIAYNEAHAAEIMPYFGQEHFIAAQEKGPLTDATYRAALARNRRLSRTEGIDATMR